MDKKSYPNLDLPQEWPGNQGRFPCLILITFPTIDESFKAACCSKDYFVLITDFLLQLFHQ
jgi:hypothetical protein